VTDRKGALHALAHRKPGLKQVQSLLCDSGYVGKPFAEGVREILGGQVTVQIARRSELHTFKVMPKREAVGSHLNRGESDRKKGFFPCFSAYPVERQDKSVHSGGFWHPQTIVNEISSLHPIALMPKRWVVERSFAWLEKNRRLWKNCGRKLNTSLQFIHLAFLTLLMRRS